jgi:spermidine/putrescine-binding protein
MDSLTRYDLIVLSTLLGARIDQMLDHLQKPVADTPEARAIYHADLAYLADLHGINAKIADVIKAAGNLVDEIKKKLNVGFLFGSPSKVTMEMGEWIGEGMSIGMDKTTRDVLESSQNLVMAARAPMMSATGGGGASSVTNNNNLGVSTTASPTVIVRSYNLMRGSV